MMFELGERAIRQADRNHSSIFPHASFQLNFDFLCAEKDDGHPV